MRFYEDVLGLELGRHEAERRAAFYWVGKAQNTMLGLWEAPPWIIDGTSNIVRMQHVAFAVDLEDMNSVIQTIKKKRIELRNFFGDVADEPSVFSWMPAASIYFHDVDGHLLEFIARIDHEPVPDIGIVSLSEWNEQSGPVTVKPSNGKAMINETSKPAAIIRRAVAEDAGGITRTFVESAEHHASLDSELYFVPAVETIAARYREGRQHPENERAESITLVAELSSDIVGFIDARLYRPTDAMHRQMIYCLVSEIAVRREHQNHGIGGQLLRAVEDWGRQQGAEFAVLEYHAANARADAFYQHMHYRLASITAIRRL
jgi:GNAT superfamily N-acetyltransferase/catechol 2,3-dioxygenase-like lactoylglutathione lyase family enzyme